MLRILKENKMIKSKHLYYNLNKLQIINIMVKVVLKKKIF